MYRGLEGENWQYVKRESMQTGMFWAINLTMNDNDINEFRIQSKFGSNQIDFFTEPSFSESFQI